MKQNLDSQNGIMALRRASPLEIAEAKLNKTGDVIDYSNNVCAILDRIAETLAPLGHDNDIPTSSRTAEALAALVKSGDVNAYGLFLLLRGEQQ